MMLKNLLKILLLFIITSKVYAQNGIYDERKDTIQNRVALQGFLDKLQQDSTATILHIGDSHIQANFITDKLRERLQTVYGDAGRGVTFPLRLAKTNGHLDIRYYSDIEWTKHRIIDAKNSGVGVAGATISTKAPRFFIRVVNKANLAISELKIIGKGLDKLKIGIPNTVIPRSKLQSPSKYYKVKSGDCLGTIARKYKISVRRLKQLNHLRSSRININQKLIVRTKNKAQNIDLSQFDLITPTLISATELIVPVDTNFSELYIINKTAENNTPTKIDGIFVANNQQGIVYNSIGINGAKYCDYNKSELFFEQLQHISPDLIIISLGTNEAFEKPYTTVTFRNDVELFLDQLSQVTVCNNILLTTPPSSLIKRRYANKKLSKFTAVLKQVAAERNIAVWDLFDIMGREQGIKKWAKKGLAARDKIHFTQDGYYLQAELLYKALFKK